MSRVSPSEPFVLIHVGKCAGGTACHELHKAGHIFEHIHVQKPTIKNESRYAILIRDPVSRFASAFHWRKFILQKQTASSEESNSLQTMKNRMELEFLSHFKDVNELAEMLNPDNPTHGLHGGISLVQLIGHVTLGFSWYLDDLMEAIQPNQILAAIAVESLAEDMENVFGIAISTQDKMDYPGKAKPLSPKASGSLRRLFSNEYRTLQRLSDTLREGGGYQPKALLNYHKQ
jgi:hypothetical protein